jgi:hypothetical protein
VTLALLWLDKANCFTDIMAHHGARYHLDGHCDIQELQLTTADDLTCG